MQTFSSKELYMMNGGNKMYIHKDGFGDVYSATPTEEAEWAEEVIAIAIAKIDTETNATTLKSAIDKLLFHKYMATENVLREKIITSIPAKQVVLATALWNIYRDDKSFDLVHQHLLQHRNECLDVIFLSLIDFRDNEHAQEFLLSCLEGSDYELFLKAATTITMWAYTGMPALRENNLLEMLKIENRDTSTFNQAIEQLKFVFQIKNKS
ncbi:hypothetical protein BH11BAC3_BH11BAC3_32280 [soil metagenome]